MSKIQAPDGTVIDFPDSMDDATVIQAMARMYPPKAGESPIHVGDYHPFQKVLGSPGPEFPMPSWLPVAAMAAGLGEAALAGPLLSTLPRIAGSVLGGIGGEEVGRRSAAALHAPPWMQAGAGLVGGMLGGGSTSKLGKAFGLVNPAEESFAISNKYGKAGTPISDIKEGMALTNANRAEGNTPMWQGVTDVEPHPYLPDVNPIPATTSFGTGRPAGPASPSAQAPNPVWSGLQLNPTSVMPDVNPIASDLPSGRVVGPSTQAPPSRSAPDWQNIQINPQSSMPDVNPIAGPLPSGRKMGGISNVQPGPVPPGAPQAVNVEGVHPEYQQYVEKYGTVGAKDMFTKTDAIGKYIAEKSLAAPDEWAKMPLTDRQAIVKEAGKAMGKDFRYGGSTGNRSRSLADLDADISKRIAAHWK